MRSFFFSSRRRHTRCALVTGVQTCALPIYAPLLQPGCAREQARPMKRTDPPPGSAPPTPVRNSIHRTGRTCLPISGTKPRIRRIRKRFWLWPLQTASAIDAKDLARDIARLVAKQKRHGGGHVLRLEIGSAHV